MLNDKVYTKKCIICGKSFETICGRALTCGKDCRNAYNREKRREQREKTHNNGNLNDVYRRRKDREKRSVKTCRNSTLDDVLGKAREAGMSYGKYVAMMDGTPKIWQGEK